MCLVNTYGFRLWGRFVLRLVDLLGGRIPESSFVDGRNGEILGNTTDPRRNALDSQTTRGNQRDLIGIRVK